MQKYAEDSPSPPLRPRHHLPPLAPRRQADPSSRERRTSSSGTSTTRTPRLSHRSRAGCYTCRGRKVKCDEIQPRCGPCTRLHRECDWEVRWNFSDATSSTRHKHSNVSTSGSAVWEPNTPLGSPTYESEAGREDNLPAFATLTNDEDRERKARTNMPGTYSVIVTPRSFADLPEYAATSGNPTSTQNQTHARQEARTLSSPNSSRASTQSDPNVVVLDRFEDLSATTSPSASGFPPSGQGGLPDSMQHMSLNIPPAFPAQSRSTTPNTRTAAESRLVLHFRSYIIDRLVPSSIKDSQNGSPRPGPIGDIFETAANEFPPLHHAICALSALNLSYRGQATLEEAIEHYDRALSAQSPTPSNSDMLSDGVFLRHYLLFIYDISMTVDASNAGAGMWADHLKHLVRLTQNRVAHFGKEPHAFVMWSICSFDAYACLMGNGDCEYFRTMLEDKILPPLGSAMSLTTSPRRTPPTTTTAIWPNEAQVFAVIMNLIRGVLVHTSKIAQVAQKFRAEAADRPTVSPGRCARWQAQVFHLQNDLSSFWTHAYPDFLEKNSPTAGERLDPRIRYVFEHAFLLYQSTTLYTRTSMFPTQLTLPSAAKPALATDTETRVSQILTLATSILESGELARREVVFPCFMAGFATGDFGIKKRFVALLRDFEGHGIGLNSGVVRKLLVGVCEEQGRRGVEGVEWLRWGRERGWSVVNCGL